MRSKLQGIRRKAKKVGAGFGGEAQALRIDESNPPVESDVNAPPQVKEVRRRSCYGLSFQRGYVAVVCRCGAGLVAGGLRRS